jgi:general stress protein 26
MNGRCRVPDDDLRKAALELMATAEDAYVTTVAPHGYPRTRAMFNLRNRTQFPSLAGTFAGHERDLLIYLGTNTSSAKIDELRKNPKGCVYFCDHPRVVGMCFAGDFEPLTDSKLRRALWVDGWERYYPAGPEDPDYTVLRMLPDSVSGWLSSRRIHFAVRDR